MSLAIKATNLSKSFSGVKVLKNININVPENSVYGFLGNNGAGKSTFIRTLLGLLKSDSGEIYINGSPTKYKQTAYKRDIGCIVDSPCMYLQLTPKEFLSITCKLKKLNKKEVEKTLELVNMKKHESIPMNKFSLGMKQRIAIANALIGSPKLLILDEPTNGLDPQGMLEIRQLLKDLPSQIGTTVFLSSHLLDEIQKTASHVGILHEGEIKTESPLETLLQNESSSLEIVSGNTLEIRDHFNLKNFKTKEVSKNSLRLLGIKKHQCAEINKQIIDSGFNLIESRFIQPSLENLFLNLVKSNTHDNVADGERNVI